MKINFFFNSVTIISSMTIVLFFFSPFFNKSQFILDNVENDPGRNEGSTPRTFILPATPAVADEQERKKILFTKKFEIQKCMLNLYDAGYLNIFNFDDIFDFKIKLGIIKYQRKNDLLLSGDFNQQTKEHLKCL